MAKIDDVMGAVNKLGTDVSKEISDAQTVLAAAIANQADPTEAAKLQTVFDSLTGIDNAVTAFDASLQGTASGTGTSS